MKNIFEKEWRLLIILFSISFFIRLLYIIFIVNLNTIPAGDGICYDMIAMNIVKGNGFSYFPGIPTSWRPPLCEFFLAGIYYLFGHSYPAVRIIQALLSAFTCLITYFMGKELGNKKVGILASLFLAFYPGAIYFSGQIYTEVLFTLMLAIGVFYSIKSLQKPSVKNLSFFGIFIGLAILTRPMLFSFLPFIFVWAILVFKGTKIILKNLLIIFLFILGTITPWTIRNYIVHHAFIPIATLGGISLFWCNNPYSTDGIWYIPNQTQWLTMGETPPNTAHRPLSPYFAEEDLSPMQWQELSEVETDRKYRHLAIRWIKEHPQEFIKYAGLKIIRLWEWESRSQATLALKYKLINTLSYGLLLPFMIMGTILSLKRRAFLMMYLLILHATLNAMIFYGSTRFRAPLDPYLLIFAGMAIYKVVSLFINFQPLLGINSQRQKLT